MKNLELEFYFYETATPEERSEMRKEMYEGFDDYDPWEDDRYWDENHENY